MSATDAQLVLTVPEVARELGVSAATVWRRARARGVRPILAPGHYRYLLRSDIDVLRDPGQPGPKVQS